MFLSNTKFRFMKKSNYLLFSLMFTASIFLYSCENDTQEEETTEGSEMISEPKEERVSPLRTAEGFVGDKEIKVQYGAPSVKDRIIWGDIAPYNEVWRTGANEATNVEFMEDVIVQGKTLSAGRYSLFTIPKQTGPWTVIFNSEWDLEHGHFQYKEENDVLRVEVSPLKDQAHQEQLRISIEEPGIVIQWEQVKLPIEIK